MATFIGLFVDFDADEDFVSHVNFYLVNFLPFGRVLDSKAF